MDHDKKLKMLEEEYRMHCARWDDFDKRALSIKAWVALGAGAAFVSLGTTSLSSTRMPYVIASLMVMVLTVWAIEALWKSWQHALGPRIIELETYFRDPRTIEMPEPLQMFSRWHDHYNGGFDLKRIRNEITTPNVYLPHAVVFIILVLWLLASICG